MAKSTDTPQPVATDSTSKSDAIFSNDALVVDYLNTLMTSHPLIQFDEQEIQIIQHALETGWISGSKAIAATDDAAFYEARLSIRESAELRNENESLKFRAELASVDSQVLRDENDKLKAEIAALKTVIHEVKESFAKASSENGNLRSYVEGLEAKLKLAETELEKLTAVQQTQNEALTVDAAVNTTSSEAEEYIPQESPAPVPAEEPECDFEHDPPETIAAAEAVMATPPAPERDNLMILKKEKAILRPTSNLETIRHSSALDQAAPRKTNPDVVIFSSRPTESPSFFRPSSTIIKQSSVPPLPTRTTPARSAETAREPASRPDEEILAPPQKPDVVHYPQPVAPLLELEPEQETAAEQEAPHEFDADELDLEPAPTPEVIVRRTVKNYEEFQKEADALKATKSGHSNIS